MRSLLIAMACTSVGAAAAFACVGTDPDPTPSDTTPEAGTGDDATLGDAGPGGFTLGGTAHFLQKPGAIVLESSGQEVTVVDNGTFVFPTPLATGVAYSVSIKTQPDGQRCWLRNAAGKIGSDAVRDVEIRCVVALQVSSGTGPDVTVSGTTELAILPPVEFIADIPSKALVSMLVPLAGPDPRSSYVGSYFDMQLDGASILKGIRKANYVGRPDPCLLTAVVDVPAGTHAFTVKWAQGGGATDSKLFRSAPTLLDLVLFESLSTHVHTELAAADIDAGTGFPSSDGGAVAWGLPDLSFTIAQAGPVLMTSYAPKPYVGTAGDVAFELQGNGAVLARGGFLTQVHSVPVLSLSTLPSGATTVTSRTRTTGFSWESQGAAEVSATVFSPNTVSASEAVDLAGDVATTATSFGAISGVPDLSLIVPRAGRMLVFFQPHSAFFAPSDIDGSTQGEARIEVDGQPVATAYFRSHTRTPLALAAVVDATAGNHTIAARFRTTATADSFAISAGRATMGALLLE